MILDVFPSYKDKDMVDLLYQFERATGSSLNILVEKYLEQLLYKEGYLTVEVGTESDNNNHKSNPVDKFSVIRKPNGRREVCFGELSFGNYKHNNVDEIISNLSIFPDGELVKMSLTNWKDTNQSYYNYLEAKFKNHSLSANDFLKKWFSEKRVFFHKKKNKYQVKDGNNNFGTYPTFEEAKEVVYFLVDKNWDEKYTTKNMNLKGVKFRERIFSEIEKEKKLKEGD